MNGPYYSVRRTLQGRWAVVHMIPGLGVPTIAVECATHAAALELAAQMNFTRVAGFLTAAYDGRPVEVEL